MFKSRRDFLFIIFADNDAQKKCGALLPDAQYLWFPLFVYINVHLLYYCTLGGALYL